MDALQLYSSQLEQLLAEFAEQAPLQKNTFFVVGCSTSEVIGEQIGTAGVIEVGESLFRPLQQFAKKHEIFLAFQGCEHINRALTVERRAAEHFGLESLSVYPTREAGGSMSAYAYEHLEDAVVVEQLVAHAGIDIGQTFIGMHLKAVAVPIRTSIRQVGEAITTAATTRPKLIGGARAKYRS